jgi:hypothetical protein
MFARKRGWPDVSLCISHKQRQKINQAQNFALKPSDAILVEGDDGKMWLHKGLKMIAHLAEKKQSFANNCTYEILEIGELISFRCEITGQELSADLDFVKAYMRLNYCSTIASCQGKTIRGRLRIYSKHPRFTRTHLYVTISRATSSAFVEVV